ncbi:MAG: FAD-binding protein, partial [Thermoplasmata archaeon]|nr:FAD-binding protein [Thermoplasmata archaeon]
MADPIASLRNAGVGPVVAGEEVSDQFGRDASHLRGRPIAVVRPRDADAVARLVVWARAERVPLVARGGGTSMEGESVPPDGGVVVDLTGWDQVLEILPDERLVRVGPGV